MAANFSYKDENRREKINELNYKRLTKKNAYKHKQQLIAFETVWLQYQEESYGATEGSERLISAEEFAQLKEVTKQEHQAWDLKGQNIYLREKKYIKWCRATTMSKNEEPGKEEVGSFLHALIISSLRSSLCSSLFWSPFSLMSFLSLVNNSRIISMAIASYYHYDVRIIVE